MLDDCSTDTSANLLLKYSSHPKVTYVEINTKNSGSTFSQWHKGVKHSSAEFVWIAESDDVSHPDFLKYLVASLDNNPSSVMAYSQSYEIDESGSEIGDYYRHTEDLNASLWKKDFTLSGERFVLDYLSQRN